MALPLVCCRAGRQLCSAGAWRIGCKQYRHYRPLHGRR